MKFILAALLVILVVPHGAFGSGEQLKEDALLAAWENAVRAEPTTEILERKSSRLYHYKTSLFPFDGELRVLNVLIRDYGEEDYGSGVGIGNVEAELVGFSPEDMARYARSYGYWYQLHELYFDQKAGRWLSGREYRATLINRYRPPKENSLVAWLGRNFYLALFVVLVLFLLFISRKSGGQVKKAMSQQGEAMEIMRRSIELSEQALRQNEETNGLLREILAQLKKDNT